MSSNSSNRTPKCFKCKKVKRVLDHHTSYFPEKKKPCCYSCHQKIHAKIDKISISQMQVSKQASRDKLQKRLKPIDFDINEIRVDVNRLFAF